MLAAKRQCLTKEERIRRRKDFLRIQRCGYRSNHPYLIVVSFRTNRARRVGITVSKKVGNAVVRNRVKRRLREAWRCHKEIFAPGFDVVLISKRSAAAASVPALVSDLIMACRARRGG